MNKVYSGAARDEAPESYGDMYTRLLENHGGKTSQEGGADVGGEDDMAREYRLNLLNMLPGNCFLVTETGFCGICPDFVQPGDLLAVWFGAPAPFVLRPLPDSRDDDTAGEGKGEKIYSVCGVAYVAGIMDGELVDEVYCEDLEDDVLFVVR